MTVINLTRKLRTNPSYLKKGDAWLANRFNLSTKTIRKIKTELNEVKRTYISTLN